MMRSEGNLARLQNKLATVSGFEFLDVNKKICQNGTKTCPFTFLLIYQLQINIIVVAFGVCSVVIGIFAICRVENDMTRHFSLSISTNVPPYTIRVLKVILNM
jgi:uncharacterized membrane protein YidH (DUF202 family)